MTEESYYDTECLECWVYDPESLSKVYDEIMHSINNNKTAVLKEKSVPGI